MTNTEEKDQSCATRIAPQLAERIGDLRSLTERPAEDDSERPAFVDNFNRLWGRDLAPDCSNDELTEQQYEAASERPLDLDVARGRPVKILLSTGGPADWFEIVLEDDGSPRSGIYAFQDWFDYAETAIDHDVLAMIDQVWGEAWRNI